MRTRSLIFLVFLISCCHLAAQPLVVAHRGASGYLPEHTLEAAALAYAMGADYIEQDLVLSKDMVPIVLHDIHLETVTDVEQRFPERSRANGRFYALDFTLAELRTLRVHERQNGDGSPVFNNRYKGSAHFQVATFAEQIELIQQLNRQLGKNVGIYPEIKAPAWHKAQGADISQVVLKILRKYDLDAPDKHVFVQCFDFAETKRLRHQLGLKAKLVQLIAENSWNESTTNYDYLQTKTGLAEVAKVANGIGPWLPQLIDFNTMQPTGLVTNARQAGLKVHPYTFRIDALPGELSRQQVLDVLFKQLKVDGIFTDFTDAVVSYLASNID